MMPWNEVKATSDSGGSKGRKEVELHTFPAESMFELGRVFKAGGLKYGDYNFRNGMPWSWLFDAGMRHAWAFWNGEDWNVEEFDDLDGKPQRWRLHHAIQAAWHFIILGWYALTGKGIDDRPNRASTVSGG
jgi:dATP/dGTP diphosphohydrolase